MEDCWTGLKAIGLRTPHAPGVMDHAHLAFVGMVAPGLKSRAGLDKLFAWLKPEGQEQESPVRPRRSWQYWSHGWSATRRRPS